MEPGFLKPGNITATPPFAGCRRYFNGAGLPEARKPARVSHHHEAAPLTSMEPGFLKPGNKIKQNGGTLDEF